MSPDALPPLPPALLERLKARYAEAQRHYHTLAHVEALLGHLERHRSLAARPAEIEAAIWFHDVVYDPRRSDNETRSAEVARAELDALDWPPGRVERVAAMVEATRRHQADERDADTWLFLDFDLSVLAAPAAQYDAYSRAIRAEFAWVPPADYHAGRGRVLASFLSRERIYRTPVLQDLWEGAARRNLERELENCRAAEAASPPSKG